MPFICVEITPQNDSCRGCALDGEREQCHAGFLRWSTENRPEDCKDNEARMSVANALFATHCGMHETSGEVAKATITVTGDEP